MNRKPSIFEIIFILALSFAVFAVVMSLGGCGRSDDEFYQSPLPTSTPVAGPQGVPGPQGLQGQQGLQGTQGQQGLQGKQGLQGQQGAQGLQGQQGAQGPQGQQGAPGTSIAVVQLCGSCKAQYPSVFPESGLCIGGQLYGVYSANDGFLSLLSPGSYSSDGINCSCNLTIKQDCVVVQN